MGFETHPLNYSGPETAADVCNAPPPIPWWARYAGGSLLLLLVVAATCGFLASSALGPAASHWRVGYVIFGVSCLVSGLLLMLKRQAGRSVHGTA